MCNRNVCVFLLVGFVSILSTLSASESLVIGKARVPNEIDNYIQEGMAAEKIEPSPICTDAEFLRRVYLDVGGAIPTAQEATQFIADSATNKRAKLIDTLLQSERYADHWEVMWGDLLREHSNSKAKEGTVQGSYREWIRDALKKNMPCDQFAAKLIAASGNAEDNPAVNFYLRDMQDRVETVNTVAQVFMGTSLACAQCHDHPFDKWTQDDFHHLMAFFGRVEVTKARKKKKGGDGISRVSENSSGEYRMPVEGDGANKKNKGNSGAEVEPVFPWNPQLKAEGSGSRREALAKFVTGSRLFAQVQVNRLWKQLFGRGFVEPSDDFRAKNPASNPELLDYLADEFIKSKFDSKHVIRLILNSATYQRSSQPTAENREDKSLFSHQRLRRMTGEETFDSVLVACGFDKGLEDVPEVFQDTKGTGKKKGNGKIPGRLQGKNESMEWAADLATPSKPGSFMNEFNQPRRDVITVNRDDNGSISQALEMLNGRAVGDAIGRSPLAEKLAVSNSNTSQQVTALYLAFLSREPTADEIRIAGKYKDKDSLRLWVEDLEWVLLNTREFTFVK